MKTKKPTAKGKPFGGRSAPPFAAKADPEKTAPKGRVAAKKKKK